MTSVGAVAAWLSAALPRSTEAAGPLRLVDLVDDRKLGSATTTPSPTATTAAAADSAIVSRRRLSVRLRGRPVAGPDGGRPAPSGRPVGAAGAGCAARARAA